MRFLMFVATDPDGEDEESGQGTLEIDEWVTKNDTAGTRILGERVRPASAATTVWRKGGEVMVSDGPFVETREWIVGFDVLECEDLDAAIAIAAEHPQANGGRLELRPFWPFEE